MTQGTKVRTMTMVPQLEDKNGLSRIQMLQEVVTITSDKNKFCTTLNLLT